VVAVMAGVVGWFVLLRRQSFAGHTLSVMAFPGASGALLVGLPAAAGYFTFAAAAALAIGLAGGTATGRDARQPAAVTGTVQALGLGCGFLFLNLYHGVLGGYESLLFGSFLGVTGGQVVLLAAVCAVTLAVLTALGRPLVFASVDEAVARAGGVPVRRLTAAFLLVLGLAVAATAQVTGVLLVLALLVAPAASAQRLTARIGRGLLLSVLLGVGVTWVALGLAYFFDAPVGFTLTTTAFAVLCLVRGGAAARERAARRPVAEEMA
jgi:zinc/manganese transport system permease protein